MTEQQQTKKASWYRRALVIMGLILVVLLFLNGFLVQRVQDLMQQYQFLKEEITESREANERVLAMLVEIRDKQEKQTEDLQKAMQITHDKRIRKTNVILLKQEGYSRYTDVGAHSAISVEDMNKIIDYYAEHAVHSTAFKGHGQAFIEAANQTGLNPIYLFAHASCESDFGCSAIAADRFNFFGINAVDSNPNAAFDMGDNIDQGIIEGAKWIKQNYYDNGYTTLDAMHRAGYASDPDWASQISSLANAAIGLI